MTSMFLKMEDDLKFYKRKTTLASWFFLIYGLKTKFNKFVCEEYQISSTKQKLAQEISFLLFLCAIAFSNV